MFKRTSKPSRVNPATLPEGKCIIAVGDIHGSATLCRRMVEKIVRSAQANPRLRHTAVFLGDYVDKGDQSRETLEFLSAIKADQGVEFVFLKGNHEDAMLEFIERPAFGPQWLSYGGGATLLSYGVRPPSQRGSEEEWQQAARELAAAMPPSHLQFLESLKVYHKEGDFLFVHAGIRPGVPLEKQSEGDMMWIRGPFLNDKRKLPVMVVHGHSPDSQPYADSRRIGVDTGAYATGRLSAVWIVGDQIRWSSVTRRSS